MSRPYRTGTLRQPPDPGDWFAPLLRQGALILEHCYMWRKMTQTVSEMLAYLGELNVAIRRRLEVVEAMVPSINESLDQLARIKLLNETCVLGEVILRRNYSAKDGPSESGQLCQAALLLPGGVGVVLWDSEEYAALEAQPPRWDKEVIMRFLPFEDCFPALQALLLPQIRPLLGDLLQRIDGLGIDALRRPN
jgi:hypothetical protein